MSESKTYGYRWLVLVIYMLLAAISQVLWLNFAAITTFVEKHLDVSAMEVGMLALVYPIAAVVFAIPSGMLIDRKGIRWGIGIGAALIGIFAALRLINSDNYTVLLISSIGVGSGASFVLNGVTKLTVTWFPEKEEATAIGLGTMALFIGMLIALGVTPLLVESVGYSTMIIIYSVISVFIALLFFIFVKERPPTSPRSTEVNTQLGDLNQWRGLKDILKVRDFVILSLIFFFGVGVFNGLTTWLEKILNELHGIALADVGFVSGLLIIGGIIGCIVIPLISDKIMKRKPFILICLGGSALTIALLLFISGFTANLINAFAMGFFLIAAVPLILTLSVEYVGARYAGISVAWMWLLGNFTAVIVVPVMELLHSSTGQYFWPLSLLVILIVVEFILTILLKEPKREQTELR